MRHSTTKRLALHQRAHGGTVERSLDEVAFPMPRQLPQLNLLRPVNDAQRFGHESAASERGAPASTHGLFLAQCFDHRPLELASRMSVYRGVNRFVADALVGIVGIHTAKSGSNLLRRPAPIDQPVMHMPVQRAAGKQLVPPSATLTTNSVRQCRTRRIVVRRRIAVARQFARNCRDASPETSCNGSRAAAVSMFDHDDRVPPRSDACTSSSQHLT